MKTIMVIGLGSMGCRRLRLLKKMRPDLRLCGVDLDESRRKAAAETLEIETYPTIDAAIQAEHPEAVVISTSPLSHSAIIRECLEAKLHIFTEMNLVSDAYEENMARAEELGVVLFLSSTFLYREEIRYIMDRAKSSAQPLSWRYHIGQYLPDWHPWEDYRKYFVGDARTNGCREIFAIELPWLQAAFGAIENIRVIHQKNTGLDVSFDDSYMVLLEHETGHQGCLCVDVVSRKAVRRFEMYGEQMYLTWEGQPHTLQEFDLEEKKDRVVSLSEEAEHQDGYAAFIVENAYTNELAAFLAQIEQGVPAEYGFQEDLETLRWIDRIEQTGDMSE